MLFLIFLLLVALSVPLLLERKLHPRTSFLTGLQRELGSYARPVLKIVLLSVVALALVWMLMWAKMLELLSGQMQNLLILVVLLVLAAWVFSTSRLRPR